jgi:hypothetical protein
MRLPAALTLQAQSVSYLSDQLDGKRPSCRSGRAALSERLVGDTEVIHLTV